MYIYFIAMNTSSHFSRVTVNTNKNPEAFDAYIQISGRTPPQGPADKVPGYF